MKIAYRWMRRFGLIILIGGLLIAGWSVGVQSVGAQAQQNPFNVIIEKLDQILAAVGQGTQTNHTLRWDTNNPPESRFVTAFPGAVLDKNTGLVWEQAPNATNRSWFQAAAYCINKQIGGTVGWRLPSIAELLSVMVPTLPSPYVPSSVFSFSSLPTAGIWSSTTNASFPENAWYVDSGVLQVPTINKAGGLVAWCVRGPMNADAY